jgi:hypothetical protein
VKIHYLLCPQTVILPIPVAEQTQSVPSQNIFDAGNLQLASQTIGGMRLHYFHTAYPSDHCVITSSQTVQIFF